MEWWLWVSVGLGLLGLELFIPSGFYLFMIGLTCVIVGFLTFAGILVSSNLQFAAAGILGIVFILTIRKPLHCMMSMLGKPTGSDITAQTVRLVQSIEVGQIGRGNLSGSSWTVRNESQGVLEDGALYHVSRTDGVTLIVTDNKKV